GYLLPVDDLEHEVVEDVLGGQRGRRVDAGVVDDRAGDDDVVEVDARGRDGQRPHLGDVEVVRVGHDVMLRHRRRVGVLIELDPADLLQQEVGPGHVRGVVGHGHRGAVGDVVEALVVVGVDTRGDGGDRGYRDE